MYHAAVLTVSDRVSRGERPDEGGPLVAELLKNAGYEVVRDRCGAGRAGADRSGAAADGRRR